MQVAATGESHPASMNALRDLLRALTQGSEQPVIEMTLEDGRSIGVPVSSPQALELAARKRLLLRVWLAQLEARMGDKAALEAARTIVEECPRCAPILLEASQVAMLLLEPAVALDWLARVPRPSPAADDLESVAQEQAELIKTKGSAFQIAALFLGQAFHVSCFAAKVAAGRTAEPGADARPALDPLGATACWLVGDGPAPGTFASLDASGREARATRLRNDPLARRDLVRELLGAR